MGRKYEHLSAEEHATIMIGRDSGLSLRAIARRLGRSASIISREVSRGRVGEGRYGTPRPAVATGSAAVSACGIVA